MTKEELLEKYKQLQLTCKEQCNSDPEKYCDCYFSDMIKLMSAHDDL